MIKGESLQSSDKNTLSYASRRRELKNIYKEFYSTLQSFQEDDIELNQEDEKIFFDDDFNYKSYSLELVHDINDLLTELNNLEKTLFLHSQGKSQSILNRLSSKISITRRSLHVLQERAERLAK